MRFLNKIYSKTTDDIQTIYKILGIKISFSHNIIPPVELPQNGKKNILLISHDLTGTGAPLALFDIAKILQKNFNITVWSIGDGILYTDYQDKMNITPFVITKISKKCKRKYAKELKKFDLVIVNTIVCDYFANICSK